ncbi:MAG: flagellar basal body P-ring protein FlgI [Pirellulaceae bacterium]
MKATRFFALLCPTLTLLALSLIATRVSPVSAAEVRIKDIITVQGDRVNKLTGMGLVTGLDGTGGTSPVTRQFAQNMLQRFGLRADPRLRELIRTDTQEKTDNLSVVVVTAELSPFAKIGSRIDVTVSAFDDAESLQGGTLVMTPLVGVDKEIYAMASGPLTIGGFSFSGDAASVQKNHPTTGRVVNGAVVEEEIPAFIGATHCLRFLLRDADFETARRITEAINIHIPDTAKTLDAGTVEVHPPNDIEDVQGFIGKIGLLSVVPDVPARVVINERTGTVVLGSKVRIDKVAITHGNISVTTSETPVVSQPAPFSERGRTEVVPRTDISAEEENRSMQVIDEPVTVGDLARALNALGVTPRDLSAIFQNLKASGALHAELEFK